MAGLVARQSGRVGEDGGSVNLLPPSSSPHRLLRAWPGGEVDLDVLGGVTMLSIKQSASRLGQMLPLDPNQSRARQGACLRKASIFEEISMLTRPAPSSPAPLGFWPAVERFTPSVTPPPRDDRLSSSSPGHRRPTWAMQSI